MSIHPESTAPQAERNRVEISVEVLHSPPHSLPGRLFYLYFITVENLGQNTVQLLERHWEIRDGDGIEQVVDGEGVIGQQPVIAPGEKFIYHSGTQLRVPPGSMRGYYTFASETNERFRVNIPEFTLYVPEGWTSPESPDAKRSPGRVLN